MKHCEGCRYWSDQIARVDGDGILSAACLSLDSPRAMTFTQGRQTCPGWASNTLGAIDEPGRDPARYHRLHEEHTS